MSDEHRTDMSKNTTLSGTHAGLPDFGTILAFSSILDKLQQLTPPTSTKGKIGGLKVK